jgi:hypothetical protein
LKEYCSILFFISEIQNVVVVAKLAWIVRNTIRKSGIIKRQMFQIDLMSLSRIYYFFGYETLKEIRKPKGPWVLVTIDLYSRYIDLQYIGNTKILEADHQFNTKLFRDFIYNFGIPNNIQTMLDIFTEEFNNHYHKGIKTTPYKVFHGYDDSHQEINIKAYPVIPNGTIVLRKPQPPRPGSVIYGSLLILTLNLFK